MHDTPARFTFLFIKLFQLQRKQSPLFEPLHQLFTVWSHHRQVIYTDRICTCKKNTTAQVDLVVTLQSSSFSEGVLPALLASSKYILLTFYRANLFQK